MVPYLVVTVEAVEAVPATEGFLDVLFIEDWDESELGFEPVPHAINAAKLLLTLFTFVSSLLLPSRIRTTKGLWMK